MSSKKRITELPINNSPSLSGRTVVVEGGVTYQSSIESIQGIPNDGTSGTSGTSGTFPTVVVDGTNVGSLTLTSTLFDTKVENTSQYTEIKQQNYEWSVKSYIDSNTQTFIEITPSSYFMQAKNSAGQIYIFSDLDPMGGASLFIAATDSGGSGAYLYLKPDRIALPGITPEMITQDSDIITKGYFDANSGGVTASTPLNAVAASQTLTFTDVGYDGDKIHIGHIEGDRDIYELDNNDSVDIESIKVNIVAVTPASGTLTVTTGGTQISEGDQVTIDIKTYKFTAGDHGNWFQMFQSEGDIHLGDSDTDALANLLGAINQTSGTYKVAALHPTVEATASDAITLDVEARTGGVTGNSIVTTETGSELSWTNGGNLIGGNSSAIAASGILTASANFSLGDTVTIDTTTYTFVNDIEIGASYGDVVLGNNTYDSLYYLYLAINEEPPSGGIAIPVGGLYKVLGPHPTVVATAFSSTALTLRIEARTAGTTGNTIATTETGLESSWTNTTLSGGVGYIGDYATGVLTFTSTPADGDTITIDGETYQLRYNQYPLVQNDHDISMQNVVEGLEHIEYCIMHTLEENVKWIADAPHPTVEVIDRDSTSITMRSKVRGVTGNTFSTTSSGLTMSWGDITLLGGADGTELEPTAQDSITALVNIVNTSGTRPVTAYDLGGNQIKFEYDIAGVIGNSITFLDYVKNASGATAAQLRGGVNGTVGSAGDMLVDNDYIYILPVDNTIADDNWKKSVLSNL